MAQLENPQLEKLPEFMVSRTDRYVVVRYKRKIYIFSCSIGRTRKVKGIPISSGDLSIDLKDNNIKDAIETVRKMYGDEEAVELVKEVLLLGEPTIIEEE